jgi:hypothetical protein
MKFTFHTFKMGDVEDVEIYASYPIDAWQKTEQGRWVMEHCKDLTWQTMSDIAILDTVWLSLAVLTIRLKSQNTY